MSRASAVPSSIESGASNRSNSWRNQDGRVTALTHREVELQELRFVALEGGAVCFAPTLPGPFMDSPSAALLEGQMESLVASNPQLAALFNCLHNALINLGRTRSVETQEDRAATARNRFVSESCQELISHLRPIDFPEDALDRVAVVGADGGAYVVILNDIKDLMGNFVHGLSWTTSMPLHLGSLGVRSQVPRWCAGLWAIAAVSVDRLLVV